MTNIKKSEQATVTPSLFSEIPQQIGPHDSSDAKQMSEISVAQVIQNFVLMEARAKAETAELQKRLVMQQFRPCKLYPVVIYHDGLRWVCEFVSLRHQFRDYEGDNVVAYGMSPEESAQNFDKLWTGASENYPDEESEDEDI